MDPETFPYLVEIDGTTYEVLAPEGEPGYRVRLPNGSVTAYPANSGEPTEANAAADIAHALANPPAYVAPARNLSKLELKARLDVLGKWSAFVTFLTSIGAWDDFILASFVSTDHPLFTTYAPQVQAGLALTDAEFASLIA
jgi:hypothetical protein